MRRLMLFTIGFALSCVVGVYLISGNWLLLLAGCAFITMIPLFCLKFRPTRIAAVILFGCAIGFLWNWNFDRQYLSEARSYDGQVVQSQIEITDYCYETDFGTAVNGKINLPGKTFRVKLYLYEESPLKPGDRVTGSFCLRYTVNGGEKAPTYHQGRGIYLLAYGRDTMQITPADQIPLKYFPATARHGILTQLNRIFPEDTLGFARALLLGDKSELSYDVDTAFRTSGISHVIAVSGMHVSILFSIVYLLGGRHKVIGAVLGIPVLIVFAGIAGFTPSIVRACVMQVLMILSLLINQEYDPPTALAFSSLLMLAVNPLTITSVSFQLSVSCMIGMFLFTRRIHDYLLRGKRIEVAKGNTRRAKLIRWLVNAVSVTLGAMVLTTPLCAYYFETVSLLGILTNLLTLWIVSFIFYGIMAACVAGIIWLPLGKGIAWVVSWGIRYVFGCAKLVSKFPLAAVYTKNVYVTVWLILCYVLLVIFLCSKKKNPAVLGICAASVLCVAIVLSWLEPRLDRYRFSVLDVGQGQCLILQSGSKTYMIDCGGDSPEQTADEAATTLLSYGIFRLDGVILTHYDADHAAGTDYLLSRVPTQKLYLPVTADTDEMTHYAEIYGDAIQWITEDTQIIDENICISLFPAASTASGNESSMCVLCQVENCDILITGDTNAAGERRLLQQQTLPDLEVLVVGHHGSKTATTLELLHATAPDAAVISVSAENNHGHPAQETLDRLTLYGCYIFRTDQMGTIIIKG